MKSSQGFLRLQTFKDSELINKSRDSSVYIMQDEEEEEDPKKKVKP